MMAVQPQCEEENLIRLSQLGRWVLVFSMKSLDGLVENTVCSIV